MLVVPVAPSPTPTPPWGQEKNVGGLACGESWTPHRFLVLPVLALPVPSPLPGEWCSLPSSRQRGRSPTTHPVPRTVSAVSAGVAEFSS